MRVHFVRHAQSTFNALETHQNASVDLSPLGHEQAERVATRLAALSADTLVSSPYRRATQTAAYIARETGLPITFTPLLAELRRPTAMQGKRYDDPQALAIKEALLAHVEDSAWRHSDEETFFELKERARACLAYLLDLPAAEVVAVTHGGILGMMVAVMLYGGDLQPRDYLRLQTFLRTTNTGITLCAYTQAESWRLLTWNDHAHLHCPAAST